jgi:hypothetical protein
VSDAKPAGREGGRQKHVGNLRTNSLDCKLSILLKC